MSSAPLPLGILIPTLNARKELEKSLPGLLPVLRLAQEVVVVDSYSEDGTLPWLEANLRHAGARFLSHPRGLYQSWNFGLQQLTSRYAHIATIGDLITPEGLTDLLDLAEKQGCDAVLSPPEFFDDTGRRIREESNWPVHRLLKACRIGQPLALKPWQAFLLATIDIPRGILGSSASNLYRTTTFQRYPFRTDCGHAGDSAWAIEHAFDTRLVLSPKVVSRFVVHPNATTGMSHERLKQIVTKLFDLAQETADRALQQGGAPSEWLSIVCRVPQQMRRLYEWQDRYNQARRVSRLWFLTGHAWRMRAERNKQRASVLRMCDQLRPEAALAPAAEHEHDAALLRFVGDFIRNVC